MQFIYDQNSFFFLKQQSATKHAIKNLHSLIIYDVVLLVNLENLTAFLTVWVKFYMYFSERCK